MNIKKILICALITVCTVFGCVSVHADNAGNVLISKDKPVKALSVNKEGIEEAVNAVDGSLNTIWAGGWMVYPQWFMIDLKSESDLSDIKIHWKDIGGRAYYYDVQISNDDIKYTTVIEKHSQTVSGVTEDSFPEDTKARYVKINIVGCSNPSSSACFSEVEIYGVPGIEEGVGPDGTKVPDTLAGKLESAIVLEINNPVALVHGKKQNIDAGNCAVAPELDNSVTLIPVRFVAECLGARVGWDDKTQTAILKKANVCIDVPAGSNQIVVDGISQAVGTASKLANARVYVPLRAISEAFGVNVLWHDDGIMVITPTDWFGGEIDNDTAAEIKNMIYKSE